MPRPSLSRMRQPRLVCELSVCVKRPRRPQTRAPPSLSPSLVRSAEGPTDRPSACRSQQQNKCTTIETDKSFPLFQLRVLNLTAFKRRCGQRRDSRNALYELRCGFDVARVILNTVIHLHDLFVMFPSAFHTDLFYSETEARSSERVSV